MKKRNSILSSAISVALLSAFLGGCSGDNPESLIASSKEFLAINDSKAAVIQLKNALQKDPNLGEARFLLGKALFESGDIIGFSLNQLESNTSQYFFYTKRQVKNAQGINQVIKLIDLGQESH